MPHTPSVREIPFANEHIVTEDYDGTRAEF
jgi:hypothetical protein